MIRRRERKAWYIVCFLASVLLVFFMLSKGACKSQGDCQNQLRNRFFTIIMMLKSIKIIPAKVLIMIGARLPIFSLAQLVVFIMNIHHNISPKKRPAIIMALVLKNPFAVTLSAVKIVVMKKSVPGLKIARKNPREKLLIKGNFPTDVFDNLGGLSKIRNAIIKSINAANN